jgi:hypothetical protein
MQSTERAYFKDEGFMTVRHLKVHGTNFEIGCRVGEIAIERHGKLPPTICRVRSIPGSPHLYPVQAAGVHELQTMRFLLDTCATAAEAKEALLTVKQYYFLVPCHYIVADRDGNSFIYENSTGRNVQHVIEGEGRPQVATPE